MRRKDKEISDKAKLETILKNAMICRIAIMDEKYPYIVPLNYGFSWDDGLVLYFHCAKEGRKIDLISRNNHVGFEIDIIGDLVADDKPCEWGIKYKSIIGNGDMALIEDGQEKEKAVDSIMSHYGFVGKPDYGSNGLKNITVYKLIAKDLSGKGTKEA